MISKKIFAIISVIGILSLSIVPAVHAATDVSEEMENSCKLHYSWEIGDDYFYRGDTIDAGDSDQWGLVCMMDSIKWITNLSFNFIMIVSVLAILVGAAIYATAGGRDDQKGTAKKVLTGAVIGVVIALVAKLVPSILRGIVGL